MRSIVLIKLEKGLLTSSEVFILDDEDTQESTEIIIEAERRFLELCELEPSSDDANEAIDNEYYYDYEGNQVFFSWSEILNTY
jgi:hypothetical protein